MQIADLELFVAYGKPVRIYEKS